MMSKCQSPEFCWQFVWMEHAKQGRQNSTKDLNALQNSEPKLMIFFFSLSISSIIDLFGMRKKLSLEIICKLRAFIDRVIFFYHRYFAVTIIAIGLALKI